MRSCITLLLICGATAAQAQSTVCWRARPLANCKTWVVTEVSIEMPVSTTSRVRETIYGQTYIVPDVRTRRTFTLGGMTNVIPGGAVGATISATSDEQPVRAEVRLHRWLSPEIGLNLTAGRAHSAPADPDGQVAKGTTASLGITDTYFGVDARLDLLRTAEGRRVRASYVSIRAGSRAAPVVTVVGVLAYLSLVAYGYKGDT